MYQFREARNDIQREIMDSAKDITSSAKEVRSEVERASQLAQKQAKKAQDTFERTVNPKEDKSTIEKDSHTNADINPLTPSDSITSTGAKKESIKKETSEKSSDSKNQQS